MRYFVGLAGLMLGLTAMAPSGSLKAQTPDQPDLEQLSKNLDDAEASFRYAQSAAAAGDTKGAIAALERVLQINPGLANIKLELGLLYLKLGQADLARSYLEAAVNAPDAPAEARIRARHALRTANGSLSSIRLTGFLSAGLQYQSNPNGSPDAVSVQPQVPGLDPVVLTGGQLNIPRGEDASFNLAGSVEAALGLGSQQGHELVLDAFASQNWYRDATELNLTYLQSRLGPRIVLGNSVGSSGFVRPYVLGSLLSLDQRKYYDSLGGGVDLLLRPSLVTTIAIDSRYEDRSYRNSPLRGTAADQSGDYWSGQIAGTWQFAARTRAVASLNGQLVDAAVSYQSRKAIGGQLGLGHAFAPPVGTLPWFINTSIGYRYTKYDVPDLLVDATTRRQEDRYDTAVTLSIPLNHSLALDARFQQIWNQANLPNYDYDNTVGSLGISLRF